MTTRRGYAEPPSNQIPYYSAKNGTEHQQDAVLPDDGRIDYALANRLGNLRNDENPNEIASRRETYCINGRENFGCNNCGNGVRGIVKTIHEIKQECNCYGDCRESKEFHV